MASRRRRRRREKLQRHEWEYVTVDESGEEVVVERPATKPAPEPVARDRPMRGGRALPEPSLQRVFKRMLLIGPLFLVLIFMTGSKELSTTGKIISTLILIGLFVPFSYLVDTLIYRAVSKRLRRTQTRPPTDESY